MVDRVQSMIKQREIAFCSLHPDPVQAHTAARFLREVEGVQHAEPLENHLAQVRYDLAHTSLQLIEQQLEEHGFHLDNRLVLKIKRALHHYTEEAQIANLHCPDGDTNCTQKVFVNRYRQLNHGCRDDRPAHWRKYL